MVETELSDYFRQLCKQSEWSLQKYRMLNSPTDRPQTDVAATKPTGREVTDDRKRAPSTHNKAPGRWQEFATSGVPT
jgi:hypothetical protein